MSGGVFVLTDQDALVPMKPASFASEDDFQRLLAKFPDLLAGQQIGGAAPRRFVLVAREKPVAADDSGAGRWSLDHLFLDQDGIPTLVEVKRQSDTRVRREVVGQMLDCAANGVAYWSLEEIRAAFEATSRGGNKSSEELVADLVGPEADGEAFWQLVKTNLQDGRIRTLFVADVIPPELRRIVEFLNNQMDPAEILALELRQYQGEGGLRTLVPTMYGLTEDARRRKEPRAGTGRKWDEASFFDELERRAGQAVAEVGHSILQWMPGKADPVWFGKGARDGSLCVSFTNKAGDRLLALQLRTTGQISINFGYCAKPPFDEEARRREWLHRINAAAGTALPLESLAKFPNIPMGTFAGTPGRLQAFLGAMDWFAQQVRDGAPVSGRE